MGTRILLRGYHDGSPDARRIDCSSGHLPALLRGCAGRFQIQLSKRVVLRVRRAQRRERCPVPPYIGPRALESTRETTDESADERSRRRFAHPLAT
jgi:hypothetical protein